MSLRIFDSFGTIESSLEKPSAEATLKEVDVCIGKGTKENIVIKSLVF